VSEPHPARGAAHLPRAPPQAPPPGSRPADRRSLLERVVELLSPGPDSRTELISILA
jgi:hypothetical protein